MHLRSSRSNECNAPVVADSENIQPHRQRMGIENLVYVPRQHPRNHRKINLQINNPMKKYLLILTTLALLGGLLERGNPRNDRRGGLGRIPDHDLLRGRFADDPGANVPAGQLQAVRQQTSAGRKKAKKAQRQRNTSPNTPRSANIRPPSCPAATIRRRSATAIPSRRAARLSATRERSTLRYSPARRFKRPLPPRSRTR